MIGHDKNIKINNIEITCEVFESINNVKKKLKGNKFEFKEEFVLDDTYIYNASTKKFAPQNGKITDTLVIRKVNNTEKSIICKKRKYNSSGVEIGTEKTVLKIDSISKARKIFYCLGYNELLRIVIKNYKYESNQYRAFIQVVDNLGVFLEFEKKNINYDENEVNNLIKFAKSLGIKIGNKFDIRKAELWYNNSKNMS